MSWSPDKCVQMEAGEIVRISRPAIEVAECLISWPTITAAEIAEETGRPESTVYACIRGLKNAGLVHNAGEKRHPQWIVKHQLIDELNQ